MVCRVIKPVTKSLKRVALDILKSKKETTSVCPLASRNASNISALTPASFSPARKIVTPPRDISRLEDRKRSQQFAVHIGRQESKYNAAYRIESIRSSEYASSWSEKDEQAFSMLADRFAVWKVETPRTQQWHDDEDSPEFHDLTKSMRGLSVFKYDKQGDLDMCNNEPEHVLTAQELAPHFQPVINEGELYRKPLVRKRVVEKGDVDEERDCKIQRPTNYIPAAWTHVFTTGIESFLPMWAPEAAKMIEPMRDFTQYALPDFRTIAIKVPACTLSFPPWAWDMNLGLKGIYGEGTLLESLGFIEGSFGKVLEDDNRRTSTHDGAFEGFLGIIREVIAERQATKAAHRHMVAHLKHFWSGSVGSIWERILEDDIDKRQTLHIDTRRRIWRVSGVRWE
ncbi:hypothetical protein Q7P37_000400 [Cladosporium fusiforme]